MIGLKNGLSAPRSTSQPAHGLHSSGSPRLSESVTSNFKKQNIISSVKKRFEEKFGEQASPVIDKYLQELNKKDKVTIHVSYITHIMNYLVFFGRIFETIFVYISILCLLMNINLLSTSS